MTKKKIIILGGDGFCGWPTTLRLSAENNEILVIDNFARRSIDNELGTESVTPIETLENRISVWKKITNKKIGFFNLDIAKDYTSVLKCIINFRPDTIIHFAEQRAAPYSMKSSLHKRYTIDNNVNATHNILSAIVESQLDIHLVHLGTMGVYGYGTSGGSIPEGYLNVSVENFNNKATEIEILHPTNPGSVYHLTKSLDQLLFMYYNKNDKLRITDLHQGIVWGTETYETKKKKKLINRFDYDGDFGTVLNRFILQSVLDYPLTVHGSGGQTRAFININDTVQCLSLAVNNPPLKNEKVKILNQMTETHRIIDLANLISNQTGVEIEFIDNPRNEDDSNDLTVKNQIFTDLGLKKTLLKEKLIQEIKFIASKYTHRINKEKIPCKSKWVKN